MVTGPLGHVALHYIWWHNIRRVVNEPRYFWISTSRLASLMQGPGVYHCILRLIASAHYVPLARNVPLVGVGEPRKCRQGEVCLAGNYVDLMIESGVAPGVDQSSKHEDFVRISLSTCGCRVGIIDGAYNAELEPYWREEGGLARRGYIITLFKLYSGP